jgi:probable rRNA maturation factor
MIEIQKNYSDTLNINSAFLKQAVQLTLDHLDQPELDITLRLTNDPEMRQLNQTFRGIAKTTDVLAFKQDVIDPETNRLYLGDIIISLDRAAQQAQDEGHPLDHEAAILVIHGTLHLLGYDHAEPEAKKEMWKVQKEIYQRLIEQTGENN